MERKWGVTDQVRGCQLQQKRGPRAERGPRSDVETRAHRLASCGAHKLALKLKREATQACILMLKHDPKVRVLKSNTTIAFGTERDSRAVLLMKFAFEVRTRLWLRSCLQLDTRSVFTVETLDMLRSASELKRWTD